MVFRKDWILMAHIKLVPFLIVFMAGVGAASEDQNAEPERSITREILLAALLANNQGEDA